MKVRLDLATRAGRIAMRAWLDAMDAEEAHAAPVTPAQEATVSEPPITPPVEAPEEAAEARHSPPPHELEEPAPAVVVPARAPDAPAPASGAAPEPEPLTPPAAEGFDPKRSLDDEDKRVIWELTKKGMSQPAIAARLTCDRQKISNWLWRVRNGKTKVPLPVEEPAPAPADVPSTALTVVAEQPTSVALVAEGGASGLALRERWREEIEERSIEGFVRKQLYEQPAP